MLRKHLRLRRREDFERVRKQGKTRSHSMLVLALLPNELAHNRYGFVVNKQLGNAIVRNRVRRQLREVMRGLHPKLHTGYDIAIIARRSLVEQPAEVMARTIYDICRQVGLMREESQ